VGLTLKQRVILFFLPFSKSDFATAATTAAGAGVQ
jgi:hypothetical protein